MSLKTFKALKLLFHCCPLQTVEFWQANQVDLLNIIKLINILYIFVQNTLNDYDLPNGSVELITNQKFPLGQ